MQRVGPAALEFSLLMTQGFLDTNLSTSLAPLAKGELEVSDTADGFSVSIEAQVRTWVTVLPVTVLAIATGGVAFLDSPIKYLLVVAAAAIAGLGWLRTRWSLDHFLDTTNEAIMESCAARPPMAQHVLPPAAT